MSETSIQDILPRVQMPSRYLGSEVNRIKKPWEAVQLRVALAFPDLYEIASSHFGLQILYNILNAQADILAERVFAPAIDMEAQLRRHAMPLCSLESSVPIRKFDIVGFSLLYELNYTNMLNMLDLSGIAFYSAQRSDDDPFIIGGGPCTCNPEPIADFFDAIVVGDGESVILEMTAAWKKWRQSPDGGRSALLQWWSKLKGVYVPSLFDVDSDASGRQRLRPKTAWHRSVQKAVIADLNDAPFPTQPLIPYGRPVHDRLRIEIARGCTRGCRFCQAGMIYRPVRERHPEKILASVMEALKNTGYEDLSLLSLSTGDYSCIAPLMKGIMAFGEKDQVAVSLPSLRAGSLTPELMNLIRKVRKTGFTIAPEAGSQRLRDVINKNITEADIVETVENAFALGWKVIKLYFMIGLPTETQADLQAIVDMAEQLRERARGKGKNARIHVSVATFVPKPHTPFQWEPQVALETATQKMEWLKAALKRPGIQLKWQDPKISLIEGIWARGDRRLGRVLETAWEKGCRFDGWSDHFDFKRWMEVFDVCGIDADAYNQIYTAPDAVLPWDHIDIGVKRAFLATEREHALKGELTADCRRGRCHSCGVCNFETLSPVSFHDHVTSSPPPAQPAEDPHEETPTHYRIEFWKTGTARFLGHLEMVKLFVRALRRAKIAMKYSQGYHPMPKLTFGDTLPMGMQSEAEWLVLTTSEALPTEQLCERLQRQLTEGIEIRACTVLETAKAVPDPPIRAYRVELKDGFFEQKDLDWFVGQPSVSIQRKSKKGKLLTIDLKVAVSDISVVDARNAIMKLEKVGSLTIRPAQVIQTIFHISDRQLSSALITKLKSEHV